VSTSQQGSPGPNVTNMLESMHAGMSGVGYDPMLSRGVGQGNDKFSATTETTTVSSNGCAMSFCHLITTGIITFIVVHVICWLYSLIATAIFGTTSDGVWNSINLVDCPFSLWGVWIALWMMMWFNFTYYYGWQTFITRRTTATTPMMVGGTMVNGGGQGFFGFF